VFKLPTLPTVTTDDAALVFRFTRNWIHYGAIALALVCAVTAAVEGLLGL
jgi:hypothetical protein